MEQTLLLNATFEPLKVIDWQRAMTLWAKGCVEILETHDREARAVKFTFKLPSVVRLLKFVRVRIDRDFVPFTRSNIYARDAYTCQYCGEAKATEDLTFDHVIPSSQGGRKSWENIATACWDCNSQKGNRTPEEAGLKLLKLPRKPKSTPVFRIMLGMRKVPASWRDWLYWNVELEGE